MEAPIIIFGGIIVVLLIVGYGTTAVFAIKDAFDPTVQRFKRFKH